MACEIPELYIKEPFPHSQVLTTVAAVGFIATILIITRCTNFKYHKIVSQVLLALWISGPPLWFFYEYFYYFRNYGNWRAGVSLEQLKSAQDVTAKVWAAFAVVLGGLYKHRFPGEAKSDE